MRKTIYTFALLLNIFIGQSVAHAAWDGQKATYEWYSEAESGVGDTQENPFIIKSESDLFGLSNLVSKSVSNTNPHPFAFDDKYFRLDKDLDFQTPKGKATNWLPIGDKKNPFRGHFDGAGHTIKNLNINNNCDNTIVKMEVYSETQKARREDIYSLFEDTPCNSVGLFGHIMNSTIKNLSTQNVSINGNYIVGGICGYACWNSAITNCIADGKISGLGLIGGICGFAEVSCTIDSCSYVGIITSKEGKHAIGGICGLAQMKCQISNCNSYTNITCENAEYVGGICGLINLSGKIKKCSNSGNITATGNSNGRFASFGGVCGILGHSCSIEVTTNTGEISVNSNQGFVGGICGMSSEETFITNNYNEGEITGGENIIAGGICGMTYRGTITNDVNVGNVKDSGVKGGVIGYNFKSRSLVAKCYYDKQTCPVQYGIGAIDITPSIKASNQGVDPLSTEEMQNFSKTLDATQWTINKGVYPTLTVFK